MYKIDRLHQIKMQNFESFECCSVLTISVFSAVDLKAGMVHAQPDVGGVVVGPEHVVHVEDDRLSGHVQHVGLVHLVGCESLNCCVMRRDTYCG